MHNCDRPVHSKGLCGAHAHRERRYGDPLGGGPSRRPKDPGAICSIEGCDSPIKSRGWCRAHYLRWYKTGDPEKIRPGRWDGYDRPTCSVDGCEVLAHAKGMCASHFFRVRRHGDPTAGRRPNSTGTTEERFFSFVDMPSDLDDCWLWNGGTTTAGYAVFPIDGRSAYGHRWSYEHHVGLIPPKDSHSITPVIPMIACVLRWCALIVVASTHPIWNQ